MTLAHLPSYGVPAALTMLAALALRLGFAGGGGTQGDEHEHEQRHVRATASDGHDTE